MSILRGVVQIPRVIVFVFLVGVSAIVCLYVASTYSNSPLIFSVTTGLVGGLTIFLFDKLIGYKESVLLGTRDWIVGTLRSRDDRAFYSNLIARTNVRIGFMGKSGLRFLTDFADVDAVGEENKRLLLALQRGVKIRFLLADAEFLELEERQKIDDVKRMIQKLRENLGSSGSNLEVLYYQFQPSFSVFIADDTVIFGSNFPGSKSRATPSIVSDAKGKVAQSYIEFFEGQWRSGARK